MHALALHRTHRRSEVGFRNGAKLDRTWSFNKDRIDWLKWFWTTFFDLPSKSLTELEKYNDFKIV